MNIKKVIVGTIGTAVIGTIAGIAISKTISKSKTKTPSKQDKINEIIERVNNFTKQGGHSIDDYETQQFIKELAECHKVDEEAITNELYKQSITEFAKELDELLNNANGDDEIEGLEGVEELLNGTKK